MRKIIALLLCLCLALALTGCRTAEKTPSGGVSAPDSSSADKTPQKSQATAAPKATPSPEPVSKETDASIILSGDSASASSNTVKIDGGVVTVTQPGSYLITGRLDDGMLIVDVGKEGKVEFVLNGVEIVSGSSAAVYVRQADKLTLSLAEGSVNRLSNGGGFTAIDDNNIDAVIFSKEDLTLKGGGALTVISPAGHGVVSKDDLKIKDGIYTVEASGHGFTAKDDMELSGGSFTVTAGKDGFHADNDEDLSLGNLMISGGQFAVGSEGDGFSASGILEVTDGALTVSAGGGSENVDPYSDNSAKAVKADGSLRITGGVFELDSADDAIHSNSSINIDGGVFTLATGDDGIHADETLAICDGSITVTESYEGLEGLNIEISGGDIDVTAWDDGINAGGGADGSGGGFFGDGFFGGERGNKFGGQPGTPVDGKPAGDRPTNGDRTAEDFFGGKGNKMQPGETGSMASLNISGGVIHVNAEGDGLDSNGTLEISGGEIYVSGPTRSGNGALDAETSCSITGGVVIAVDSSGMAQNFSSAAQGSILLNTGGQEAGSTVQVTDESSSVLVSWQPEKSYSTVVISCPGMKVGGAYTVSAGSFSQTVTLETEIYGSGFSFGGKGGHGMRF